MDRVQQDPGDPPELLAEAIMFGIRTSATQRLREVDAQLSALHAERAALARLLGMGTNGRVGGKVLSEYAFAVLRDAGKPMHYRAIQVELERAGHRAAGVDPDATLLTALHRDPRVEPARSRSGLWRVA